jgi:3-methyladenine DNA glycosylase AlkD
MSEVVGRIREELNGSVDEKTRASFQRFFKEKVKCYGVKTAVVGKIAKKYWKDIGGRDKEMIFDLCEELYESGYIEDAFVVSFWGANFKDFAEPGDLKVYERWIGKYIDNWAKCDGFCNHAVGDLIVKYPDKVTELERWARSDNRWMRRASAVTLIVPAKRGLFLEGAFGICDILLEDDDDMVQKGYGWLLKEESRTRRKDVFDYVMRNKARMPRTALRYAIELMPEDLRSKAMGR